MADTVVDIIHRLSFDVNNTGLQKSLEGIRANISNINTLQRSLDNLKQKQAATAKSDVQAQQAIAAAIRNTEQAIQRQTQAVQKQTQAVQKQIAADKTLQDAFVKEASVIGSLTSQLNRLTQARDQATDTKQIKQFNQQIGSLQGRLTQLTAPSGKGGAGVFGTILQGIGIGTGVGLVTTATSFLKDFIVDSTQAAIAAEGIEAAFSRLNAPGLLDNLRESTRGTISDLELMRTAVNARNFQVPLERLGGLLAFARQRARDTGQEVDYLVNSIILGIGRKSPLILDNLGINVARVREEFKKTGDFAQAAFNIIDQEAAKAGVAIDTHADKIDRAGAKWANFKVQVGEAFLTLFDNLTDSRFTAGTEGNFLLAPFAPGASLLGLFNDTEDEVKNAQQNLLELQNTFVDNFRKSDAKGREQVLKQADDFYTQLQIAEQASQERGLNAQATYYSLLIRQFQGFFQRINNITGGGDRPTTLADLRANLQLQQELLEGTSTEAQRVPIRREITRLQALIDQAVGKDAEKNLKAAEAATERWRKAMEKLNDAIRIVKLSIADLGLDEFNAGAKELLDQITAFEKFSESLRPERDRSQQQQADELIGPGTTDAEAAALERQLNDQKIFNATIAERKKKEEEEQERRKQHIAELKDAYASLVQAVSIAFNALFDKQQELLDREITIRQQRVDQATQLAERGATEQLRIEQERLDAAQQEREKIARQQIALNAILQASNSAVALSEAIGAVVAAAAKGDPYTIAARVAAAVAALVGGIAAISGAFGALNSQGFAEGVIDLKGPGSSTSDSIPARLSRGESVMTAMQTQKYKPYLQAMRTDTFFPLVKTAMSDNYVTKAEFKEWGNKLDTLNESIQGLQFRASNSIDGSGVHQIVETQMKINRRTWNGS